MSCRLLVVVTGRDVADHAEPLIASLAEQRDAEWRAVLVDDASQDDTHARWLAAVAARGLEDRVRVRANAERLHKARNVFRVIRDEAADDEVIVLLDADDRLGEPRALARLAREYTAGWDVVWSNWRGSDGSRGKSDALNPWLAPHRQPFLSQHLFSFRKPLFDGVDESDLQDDDGRWFRAGCDVAIAWPVLERTRRRRFLDRPLCIYNVANPRSHKASGGKAAQIGTIASLRRRPRGRPPADWWFRACHAGEELRATWRNVRLVRRYIRHERRIRAWRNGATSIR